LTANFPRKAASCEIVATPLNEEQHADAAARHQVAHRIEPVVAGPVGELQRLVVDDVDEARHVAARGGIAAALGIRGGQHEERRPGDEQP
jgi:hypothetical protein